MAYFFILIFGGRIWFSFNEKGLILTLNLAINWLFIGVKTDWLRGAKLLIELRTYWPFPWNCGRMLNKQIVPTSVSVLLNDTRTSVYCSNLGLVHLFKKVLKSSSTCDWISPTKDINFVLRHSDQVRSDQFEISEDVPNSWHETGRELQLCLIRRYVWEVEMSLDAVHPKICWC